MSEDYIPEDLHPDIPFSYQERVKALKESRFFDPVQLEQALDEGDLDRFDSFLEEATTLIHTRRIPKLSKTFLGKLVNKISPFRRALNVLEAQLKDLENSKVLDRSFMQFSSTE